MRLSFLFIFAYLFSSTAFADSQFIAECDGNSGSLSVTLESWDMGPKSAMLTESIYNEQTQEPQTYSYYGIEESEGTTPKTYLGTNFKLELLTSAPQIDGRTQAKLNAITDKGTKIFTTILCTLY